VRVAGARLEDGEGFPAAAYAVRRKPAFDTQRPPLVVEERDVDREAHPERVHGAAVRDQEGVAGRQAVGPHERKPEQPRTQRGGLEHGRAVRQPAAREALKSAREHADISAARPKFAPLRARLDSGTAALPW
jgi:hypothetical protein